MEFLLRGDAPEKTVLGLVSVRSSTAPAVLGRESCVPRDELRARGDVGSLSAIVELDNEISEDMLPETEWLGRTVMVLDVSLETRERGRGMNSIRSEKPTLARPTGLGVGLDSSATLAGSLGGVAVSRATGSAGGTLVSASVVWAVREVSGNV